MIISPTQIVEIETKITTLQDRIIELEAEREEMKVEIGAVRRVLLQETNNEIADSNHLRAINRELVDAIDKTKGEFERIKETDISLRDRLYLDGVLAVIDSYTTQALAHAKEQEETHD